MARKPVSDTVLRNGFKAVSRAEAEAELGCLMQEAEELALLSRVIRRLSAKPKGSPDLEIRAVAEMMHYKADLIANELDVLQERIAKAGLIGDLAEEARAA